MSEPLAIPTKELLAELREMLRQWRQQGRRLDRPQRLPSGRASGNVTPICQAIEITSDVADDDGYPARLLTLSDDGTWEKTYDAIRALKIGGGVLEVGFCPPGRLMRVNPETGYHIYGVYQTATTECEFPTLITVTLTSDCADANGLIVTLEYDPDTETWTGEADTPTPKTVELTLYKSTDNRYYIDMYFDGDYAGQFHVEVISCDPLEIELTSPSLICYDPCPGFASGSYATGGDGGGAASACCGDDANVPSSLCLTSSVISGACAELAALSITLTYDAGRWTTGAGTTFCLSPWNYNCVGDAVRPYVSCTSDAWEFGWESHSNNATQTPIRLATAALPGICTNNTMTFDVDFDSGDADVFPPGHAAGCCDGTVRFTVTRYSCAAPPATPIDTACCGVGEDWNTTLYVTSDWIVAGVTQSWTLLYVGSFGTLGNVWEGYGDDSWNSGMLLRLNCTTGGVEGMRWAGGAPTTGPTADPFTYSSLTCAPLSLVFTNSGYTFTVSE